MFCHKCGTKIAEDASFCQKCGAKVTVEAALNHTEPTMVEAGQDSQQATLNDAAPTKTGGLKSIFRTLRNILMGFAILLALFSMLGLVGVIIGVVVFSVLVIVGWRMTVAEERKKEE